MSTRRTGCGMYRPSSNACFTLGQCTLSQSLNSVTVRSSTPGAPLFLTTRWYASHKLLRSTTHSIRWSSDFVRPGVAVRTSAPSRRVLDFRPAPCVSAPPRGGFCLIGSLRVHRSYSRPHRSALRHCGLLWPLLTSGDASEDLSILVAQRHTARSPRVLRTLFHAYARRIYAAPFRASTGLRRSLPSHPSASPLSASCSSRQRFASGFLQTPGRPGSPCRAASTSPCRVCGGLSPPRECARAGRTKKRPAQAPAR